MSQSRVDVAQARGKFGNLEEMQRPLLAVWKQLQSNGAEEVIVDTSV
jgi:hypothetical protein